MYYLIEKTVSNGTPACAVWAKEDLTSAQMQLHQTLASAMANTAADTALCMIIDEEGAILKRDYWSAR